VAAVKKKGRASGRWMGAGRSASTCQREADGMAPPPLLANPATRRRRRGGGDADAWARGEEEMWKIKMKVFSGSKIHETFSGGR